MLNRSQETANRKQCPDQLRPTHPSNAANQMHPTKPGLTNGPNIHELEQMLANQRLGHTLVHNPGLRSCQTPSQSYMPTVPNSVQPNYFKLNPTAGRPNAPNPTGHLTVNQASLRLPNVAHPAMFNVPNIRRHLDPNYENLNSLAGHPINSQLMKSAAMQTTVPSAHVRSASPTAINQPTTLNRNLISPNITGLPEASVTRKPNSSSQGNIYANSSIVSRYCPPPNEPNAKYQSGQFSSYRETNIDQYGVPPARANEASSMRSGSIATNDLNSLYDPVYYRTNSQLSFDSNPKDDSVTYSTYAPPSSLWSLSNPASNSPSRLVANSLVSNPTAAAGNRQPITELLNNDANSLAYDKSLGSQALKENSGIIDHPKNEKEVDYLTSLLVKGLESSTEADFFGKR